MMRNLTPDFILRNLTSESRHDKLQAVVLFVDTSGFTPLTARLMTHGKEGAEVLADIMLKIFDPLINSVYAHGGFVANFAGDAFTAIFPEVNEQSTLRALAAGEEIRRFVTDSPQQETTYGHFDFSVRVCVAAGAVSWMIWSSMPEEQRTIDQRGNRLSQTSAFSFMGEAIDLAVQGENYAEPGELLITRTLADKFLDTSVNLLTLEPLESLADGAFEYLSVNNIREMQPAPISLELLDSSTETHLEREASYFFPRDLLKMSTQGEFRTVYSLFLTVPTMSNQRGNQFMSLVFRLLNQYGGYLCRVGRFGGSVTGTSLLFFWGAPTSYENDEARALNFLLDLRDESKVPIRAGITYGMVYAGFVGSQQREEYTCYGTSVNLASRQMGSAEPNQIFLDTETARRADAQFDLSLAGHYTFKGFAEELAVFELRGRRKRSHRFTYGSQERLQPASSKVETDRGVQTEQTNPEWTYRFQLVGRRAELVQLHAAIQPIFKHRFGGVVLIRGEAGIGKSRLVSDFLTTVTEQEQVQVFLCQTDEILRESLNPFRYFLHSYFNQSQDATDTTNKARFNERLDALISILTSLQPSTLEPSPEQATELHANAASLATELERTRSILGALVGLNWRGSLYERLSPQLRFENMLAALKTLFKAESLQQPLIIHLEDAHWLDADSAAFMAQLVRNVEGFPFVVIATTREEEVEVKSKAEEKAKAEEEEEGKEGEQGRVLFGLPGQVEIQLKALTAVHIGELAQDYFEGTISQELVALLVDHSEGNPFFAEQIVLFLQEQELVVNQGGRWQLVEPAYSATLLSTDMQSVLVARLDRLAQEVKQVVQTAAVLGREFSILVLSQMLRDARTWTEPAEDGGPLDVQASGVQALDDQALSDRVRSAQTAAVWSALSEIRYLFRHTLLREAAYEMQLRARLRLLHQLAAEGIEKLYGDADLGAHYPDLVYHYRQANLSDREFRYAKLAAARAATAYANEDAIEYYTRALALTPVSDLEQRFDLLVERVKLYDLLGKRSEQADDLATLAELGAQLDDDKRRADIALRQSRYAETTGDYPEWRAAAERAIAWASDLPTVVARATAQIANALINQARYTEAQTRTEEALRVAQKANLPWEEAASLHQLGIVHYQLGHYAEAQGYFYESLAIYRALDEPLEVGRVLNSLGIITSKIEEYRDTRFFEEAIEIWRTIGYTRGQAIAGTGIGNIHLAAGAYDLAQRYYQRSLQIAIETNDPLSQGNLHFNLAIIASRVGLYEEAVRGYQKARQRYEETGYLQGIGTIWLALGNVERYRGELETSRTHFETALRMLKEIGAQSELGDGFTSFGATLFEMGQIEEAQKAFERSLTIRRKLGRETISLVPLGWLARLAAEMGNLDLAQHRTGELFGYLDKGSIDRVYDPGQFYFVCYQTLLLLQHERADEILKTAYDLLQSRANQISNQEMAHSYLQNVPTHRELVRIYEEAK